MAGKKRGKKEQPMPSPLLDAPRVLLPQPRFSYQFLFYSFFLMLGGLGAMGCFYSAFQVPLNVSFLAVLGVGHAMLSVLFFLPEKSIRFLPLTSASLWLFTLYLWRDDLAMGCMHIANLVINAYAARLNTFLPLFPVVPENPGQAASWCTVAAVLLLLPFFSLFSWLFIRRKSGLGVFCETGLFLLAPLLISLLPKAWALAVLLLFWVVLLLCAPALGRRRKLANTGRDRTFHASGVMAARPMTLLLVPAAVLCMLLVYGLFPQATYHRPKTVDHLRDGVTDGFGLGASLKGGVGSGNRSVEFSTVGDRSFTGETVLQVKYDWGMAEYLNNLETPKKDYLKSFVGSVYTEKGWERLSSEDSEALEHIWRGELAQTLPVRLGQFLPLAADRELRLDYTVSVKNLKGNPRCAFLPYGLKPEDLASKGLTPVDDSFVKSSSWISGTREYTLRSATLPDVTLLHNPLAFSFYLNYPDRVLASLQETVEAKNDPRLVENLFRLAGEPWQEAYPTQSDALASLLFLDARRQKAALSGPWDDLHWKAGDWALAPFSNAVRTYVSSLENYNEFVLSHYTQLPEELSAFLAGYREAHGLNNYVSTVNFINRLYADLSVNCTYTMSPGSLPEGRDFVEYFLSEKKEGYCVHFATAAVALLRSVGIPARYAEGYVVPSAKRGWVNVPDYNAHAWAEVYLGGLGWVPVDFTPISPDAPATYEDATVPEDAPRPGASSGVAPDDPGFGNQEEIDRPDRNDLSSASSRPGQDLSPEEVPEEAGVSSGRGLSPLFLWCLSLVSVLVFLVLLLLGLRRFRVARRRRLFSQPDRNKALLYAYGYMARLCVQGKRLLDPKPGIAEELEALALKARFSQHAISQEELDLFLSGVARLEELLLSRLSPWEIRRCRYLLGLL